MKKISIRLMAIALVAAFSTAFVSPAFADDDKKAIPVELKFVGNMKNKPLFHLVFNGTEEKEYTITVTDAYGNVFYRENVKGTSFMKKFLINTEDVDETELKFEISSKSFDKSVVFEVNNHSRYVENIVVNKVK